jgi:putative NADH-flavin reductase
MILLLVLVSYAVVLSVALARAGYRSPGGAPNAAAPSGAAGHRASRVLIVGATGGTGRQLVQQALDRGLSVTALARDPSRLRIDHPRLKVIQGNVLDERSIDAAMRGQEAVVSALGHKRFFYPTGILSDGTRNVVRAMETHGVRRLVCVTSLGIGDSAGRLGAFYTLFIIPVILPFYFWDKTRQERIIARSRVEWVIVRPGALTNGRKRGRCRHGRGVGNFLLTVRISRADVAEFMLDQLASDTYVGAAPGVCW